MKPVRVGLPVIALIAGIFTVSAPLPAAAKECKKFDVVRTGGMARTELFAKSKARSAWRAKVKQKYGRNWAGWFVGEDRRYDCRKALNGTRKRCKAIARPCSKAAIVLPGKNCKLFDVHATGKKRGSTIAAKSNARSTWKAKVVGLYGKGWGTWLLSNSRRYTCKAGVCTAKAFPCRFGKGG